MAVETTNALSGPFIPNGVTTTFPFTFTAPSADEVDVMLRAADGTETLAVGYAVTLNPSGGGSVVFSVAPAAGPELYILLEPFFTQQIQFENGSGWLAEPVNEVADRSAARDQVLRREIGRSLRMPLGEDPGQLPSKTQLANKFIGGDAMGEILALRGTGNDPDFRDDAADPAVGPRLWGFRQPITEALARHAQGKFEERVSVFDFLPYGKHGQILDRTNNDDLAELVNEGIFQNPECRGARVFTPPGLYNVEQPLVLMQHMTLYGAAGREMMDNSADAGGDTGSRWRYRGNSGHLLTLTVPDEDNCRTIPVLRDMLLQHNRLLDNEAVNPDRVDGCTLYCAGGLGPTQGDRQLRYILDNVALYGGIDHNMLEEGNTYGSEIRYLHSMRAGLNGMRAINGPLGGERRIGMVRLFQNGWDGTTEMDRAGGVISSGAVEIGKISASESKGPGLILGGVVNIGTMQLESNGVAYTDEDDGEELFVGNRKQIVLGWQDNGIASLNVQSCIIDAGPAYRGARIFHSRYASNVRIKGLITNTLGAGGRCVETQAPVVVGPDTFACGLIDVTDLNATVFVDNSQRYCIKSGIEVRLRHGAHIALTGDDTTVPFQPAELFDSRNSYAANRFTAPHNLILDGSLLMALSGMDKANHDRMRIYVDRNGAAHRTLSIDPSSFTRAGGALATLSLELPSLPLDQGDYIEFRYDVTGGGQTVGLVANESYLKLTALPR